MPASFERLLCGGRCKNWKCESAYFNCKPFQFTGLFDEAAPTNERPPLGGPCWIGIEGIREPDGQADAARLPFADAAFDAVISNHSLEHFHDLAGSLAEIGRVLKPTGALYVAVPDASTFCDRLYRWLA